MFLGKLVRGLHAAIGYWGAAAVDDSFAGELFFLGRIVGWGIGSAKERNKLII